MVIRLPGVFVVDDSTGTNGEGEDVGDREASPVCSRNAAGVTAFGALSMACSVVWLSAVVTDDVVSPGRCQPSARARGARTLVTTAPVLRHSVPSTTGCCTVP